MSTTTPARPRNGRKKTASAPSAINAEQLAVFSDLVSRLDFARQHGMQYDGDRDLYKVGGYPRTLAFSQFEALYDRDSIAGQIVDMPAETTWRASPEVVEPEQEDGTEFTRQWTELVKRLRLWQRFERAERLARIGRYGVLLIGVRGGDDSSLQQPMPQLQGPDDVLYVSAFSERYAKIEKWVTDPGDPRYGQPEQYKIDMASGVSDFRSGGVGNLTVHHSRCIHIAEGLLSDEVYGREALRRVYNDILDLQKVTTSTAEAFWQRVAGILTAKIDPEAQTSTEQLEQLDEHLKELYHELRKTFYGQGVELGRLAESEPDPEQAASLYMTRIAAGAGIPKRMLFGSETGERASSEDQKTYLGSIAERQKQHAEPGVLRPFIDRLIEHGGLTRPGREGYEVVWPALFEESETTIATANLSRAQTAMALTPVGGDPLALVEIDEERNVWLVPRTPDDPSPFDLPEPEPDDDGNEPPGGLPDAGGEE